MAHVRPAGGVRVNRQFPGAQGQPRITFRPTLEFLFVARKCSAKSQSFTSPRSNDDDQDHTGTKWLLREEVEMVMKRLGLSCNPSCNKKDKFSYHEIENMFNVDEPSLGEVRQAFDLFDENCDGYIDETELDSVLKRLGLKEFSKTDCQRMIKIYDRNGDGLVDFSEFCKLVEDSFC
ncbi:EF-hand domain-containing protein [Heracleum sosnowskyi]|uniref:EF-hand domain-containing protein n=1 Tax=Heracleum sosnowskyi TaxID=360622 RepID=A0AAD8HBE2_9APIA|nr:EF-hand domain-containing protein [Heracleum sosnowskyi]